MSRGYGAIAQTEYVRAAQVRLGSRAAVARRERSGAPEPTDPEPRDPLTATEQAFIGERDGFYLASVSESGWPYVQFRGGPPGFVRSPDAATLAWAEFRGNRQYISTGNVADDGRVALFFMDYPNQLRLKVFGRARFVDARDHPEVVADLTVDGYRAVVEQAVLVTVVAFDWNCPQHITPRFSGVELEHLLDPNGA
ncbi:pyridoxamine 5'-phosphate oxidase family protein [Actinomycetospora sp. CA-101289]|uniref:pyridoxamine 5'-phosphate oxidase family protein n=1 Tax=Actinomycetospora sp. CA-101289 TaxID=3239893 RepID=UPI003D96B4E4